MINVCINCAAVADDSDVDNGIKDGDDAMVQKVLQ